MKLFIFSRNIAAFVAALCLVSASLIGSEHHKTRHHSSCHDSCKSIKKQLHNVGHTLDRIEQLEHHLTSVAPTPISQKNIDHAGGTLTLCYSGDYCVTEDIKGVLVIGADNVCLDLCCHTLDAKGLPSAIIATGYQGLKVFDGRIIHSETAAIKIQNYSSIELFKLVMNDHGLDSIRIANSFDINVHDVDFINDNSGERAVWLNACDNITINHCNASGFWSTIGAIIQLDSCNAASVQDVDVSGNTKTSSATTDEFSPGTAFVSVALSTGVDFARVKVNNNTFNNNVPVADPNNHFRTAEGIGFVSCSSCSLRQCETSNNTDIAGNIATEDTEDFPLLFLFCNDFEVLEHKSNNNSVTTTIDYLVDIAIFDSINIVLDGCQANNNAVAELPVGLSFFPLHYGIWLTAYYGDFGQGHVIRNCQANFNTVEVGAAIDCLLVGIYIDTLDTIVDNCQANSNQAGAVRPLFVAGILCAPGAQGSSVSHSTTSNNTGGIESIGMLLRSQNLTVADCQANDNGNYGIIVQDSVTGNILITDCICTNNGGNPGLIFEAGIAVFHVEEIGNILIKGCQIYGTKSGFSDAAGIFVLGATNIVIEDCNIFDSSSLGFTAHGIRFDTVTDSKIIRTQVHGNQNSGVELVGVNTNVLILDSIAIDNDKGFSAAAGSTLVNGVIQGNKALGNTSFGFEHAAVLPVPFDTGYQNNYAQDNGVNYSISNIIQLFTYSIPTATYTLVPNGASNFPTQANIDAS